VSHLYEAAVQTPSITAVIPVATVVAGAQRAEVRELCVSTAVTASLATILVGRPAVAGAGALTGALVQATDSADAAGLTTLVAGPTNSCFGTSAPTAPAVAMRQFVINGTAAGGGVVFAWEPGELVIPASGQLVVWLLLSGGGAITFDVFAKVAE